MFFANFVLAKKGPLARVWLAAHWEKKLSKAHVFETDIESSINSIMSPTVKIALRTSGHLLLGVVRIHSRKAKYLLADCSEAIVKIKMAFRPDVVDLPLDNQKASVAAITLPEVPEWDVLMNDFGPYDVATSLNKNQCRVEEITMKEDLIPSRFMSDDSYFGDTQFGDVSDREMMRDEASMNENLDIQDISKIHEESTIKDDSISLRKSNIDFQMNDIDDGGFGAGEGLDFLEGFGGEVGEIAGLEDIKLQDVDELDQTKVPEEEQADKTEKVKNNDDVAMDIDGEKEATVDEKDNTLQDQRDREVVEEISAIMADNAPETTVPDVPMETVIEAPSEMVGTKTTLFSRDSEGFALEPVDDTMGKEKKKKRKRKLIVDEQLIIKNEDMKEQLRNPEDLVKAAVVAPPTKARMLHLDMNLKRLFTEPAIPIFKSDTRKAYLSNLSRTIPKDLEIPSSQNEEDEIQLEIAPEGVEDIQLPRDELQQDVLPELTTELENIEEKTNAEEDILDEFKENISELPPVQDDLEMHFAKENDENEITIPPPFELEKSVNQTKDVDPEDDSQEVEFDSVDSKKWTKRTHQTYTLLERQWKKSDEVNFKDITKKSNRKQAALKFYSLLILSKAKAINLRQDTPFGDIFISAGDSLPILKSPIKSPMKSPTKSPMKSPIKPSLKSPMKSPRK